MQSLLLHDVGSRRGQEIPLSDDGELRHRGGGAGREGEVQSHGIVFRLVERGERIGEVQRQAARKAPVIRGLLVETAGFFFVVELC